MMSLVGLGHDDVGLGMGTVASAFIITTNGFSWQTSSRANTIKSCSEAVVCPVPPQYGQHPPPVQAIVPEVW